MMLDSVNAFFELGGSFFVALHCLKLYRDKKVRGVSAACIAYMVLWGFFNLIYYPSLGQWRSAIAASSVAIINSVWLCQMIYYKRKEKK
jgi:uncharacterized membrane protein YfcA